MTHLNPTSAWQYNQHTLKDSFTCIGVGLHTGLKIIMTVMPAEANTGIRFVRKDISHGFNEVLANWHVVSDTHLNTTVSNRMGVRVSTIEHLMAALFSCGIDNALVVLDGPEIPIMDGSALPFVNLIEGAGRKNQHADRKAIVIKKTVILSDGKKFASLQPSQTPILDITIDFDSKVIGKQHLQLPMTRETISQEIAHARTFGFAEQVTTLKQLGFARGGSLKNAILVHNDKVLNKEGLRNNNEFVRHKALDCVGDLALAGAPIIGEFKAQFPGHKLTNLLLHELMRNTKAYEFVSIKDLQCTPVPTDELTLNTN